MLILLTDVGLGIACDAAVPDAVATEDSASVPPADSGGLDDADGDGFPAWFTTADAAIADCDDADPAVTPAEEVYIPAGAFTRVEDGLTNAEPARTITLSAYCIDAVEVTNAAFRDLLDAREASGLSNLDDAGRPLFDVWDADDEVPERLTQIDGVWGVQAGYEEHPVVEVWEWSAEFFCASHDKSVPTEAQWEKAARGAVDARRFPWGDDAPDCSRANYAPIPENSGGTPVWCVGDTSPVRAYPLGDGPTGISGMAGNVAEWVSDWFDPDGYATDTDTDPVGPAEGEVYNDGVGEWVARVDRGGNHSSSADGLALSYRFPEPEDATSNGVGFRCARLLVVPP